MIFIYFYISKKTTMKKTITILVLFFVTIFQAQTIAIQSFGTSFSSAVELTHPANDSRFFVVQQRGLIRILNANGTVNATPFINLSSLVSPTGSERGLLGMTFHPNYAVNGKFYVNYTRASDGATTIASYNVNPANPNLATTTATILMTIPQPYANHNGGSLKFGPDGLLYIGMGDGGSGGDPENRSQNINENLGKMLRIDVDTTSPTLNYGIPPTNPYVGIAGNDEIWAIGVRNPWKFSFNRVNGDMWIADVGQNTKEEINKIVAPLPTGLNFGWRCYEGNSVFLNSGCPGIGTLKMPFAEYGRDNGCSITGGFFYTGSQYPNFANKYFFADYCENRLGYINTAGTITYTPNFTGSNNFTTFGEDRNGELYVCNGSVVYKIVDTSQLANASFETAGLSLYPNPAENEFFIQNSKNLQNLYLSLFDVTGKLLVNQSLETGTNSISTSSLTSGLYLVTVQDKEGNIYNSKLVLN